MIYRLHDPNHPDDGSHDTLTVDTLNETFEDLADKIQFLMQVDDSDFAAMDVLDGIDELAAAMLEDRLTDVTLWLSPLGLRLAPEQENTP